MRMVDSVPIGSPRTTAPRLSHRDRDRFLGRRAHHRARASPAYRIGCAAALLARNASDEVVEFRERRFQVPPGHLPIDRDRRSIVGATRLFVRVAHQDAAFELLHSEAVQPLADLFSLLLSLHGGSGSSSRS